ARLVPGREQQRGADLAAAGGEQVGRGTGGGGSSAWEAIGACPPGRPSVRTVTATPRSASDRPTTTLVPPAPRPARTPCSGVIRTSSPWRYSHRPTSAGSAPDAVNSTASPSVSATARAWSPGGVTGAASASSAGAATRSRLAPPWSAVHAILPSPV